MTHYPTQQALLRRFAREYLQAQGRGDEHPDEVSLGAEGLEYVKGRYQAWVQAAMDREEEASWEAAQAHRAKNDEKSR